ncbi:MAG: hypothetical protein H8E42_03395 [Nitrospinae bacterium]|nr:hypothetical protein [Nitrospinota bacterium]MBL7020192.1 hypothetical protein [Nitrospinaceae bacterium]
MNKNSLTSIAGGLWCVIGMFLIFRGFGLYQLAGQEQHSTQIAISLSIITAVLIGLLKGRFVLSKTARKNKARIHELADPVRIHQLFAKPFYFFIPMMMGLGVLLRSYNEYLGGYVVVAAIYCGIGMALIISSRTYWAKESTAPAPDNS